MKKVFILFVILVVQLFATLEKQEVDGSSVRIIINEETNQVRFEDSFLANRSKDTFYQDLRERGNKLFSFIENYGKEKGFKSFSIENKFLSQSSGFLLDNSQDIVKYCTLGKKYTTFCSAGSNGILFSNATQFNVKIIFYKDNSGAISF